MWVVAESKTSYTWDFNVYLGKAANLNDKSETGLGYDVVMDLMKHLLNQGYHVLFDNFYTSIVLVKSLHKLKTPSCGTVAENGRISRLYEEWQNIEQKDRSR